MVNLIFKQTGGGRTLVKVASGMNVMEAAVASNVSGVVAECGGACACATCHVYIPENWIGKLSEPDRIERDMLEFARNPRFTSRLACQIIVTEAMDSIVIEVPEAQC